MIVEYFFISRINYVNGNFKVSSMLKCGACHFVDCIIPIIVYNAILFQSTYLIMIILTKQQGTSPIFNMGDIPTAASALIV